MRCINTIAELRSPKFAFTLIELLIVVAILGILAAIAVPNFLAAQTRAKISAAKGDFRSLGMAADMYKLDWSWYPPWDAVLNPSGDRNVSKGYFALTSPVAYLSDLENARDKFATRAKRTEEDLQKNFDQFYEFAFGASDGGSWVTTNRKRDRYLIESVGPDLKDSIYTYHYPSKPPDWVPYHTSNGLYSEGDLYRAGGPLPEWLSVIESP